MVMRRRTVIYLTLSLMTASWLTVLLKAFLGDAGSTALVTFVVLSLLTLIPLEFSRWVRGLDLKDNLHRGFLTAVFAFLSLLVLSSGFYNDYGLFGGGWVGRVLANELSGGTFLNQSTSLVLTALCWWLGMTLGNLPLTSANLLRYFYICMMALALPSIFFVTDVSQVLLWLYFAFLFAALIALGLGRVEEAARRSQNQGSSFTLYWLFQIGLISGMVLGIVGLAHVLRLGDGFGLVLVVVMPILALIAYPLVFIAARVGATLLGQILGGLSQGAETTGENAGSQLSQTVTTHSAENVCVGLAALVLFLGVFVAIIYATRRWRELIKEHEREERAALPSLGQRVSGVLEERLERLGFNFPGLGHLRRRLAARSIRRIFAALTALAAERGYARPAARTPYEHLAALKRAFPGCEVQVERITEAYVTVHYGEALESREALREIRVAWEHVREMARRNAPIPGQGVAASRSADAL